MARPDKRDDVTVASVYLRTMIELPDLSRVFFDANDSDDHADDSCCLSLRWPAFVDNAARWAEVRDQHLEALRLLAGEAQLLAAKNGEAGSWFVGRPLLFAAHHAAELAFKTALLAYREDWPKRTAGHDLQKLLELERTVRGVREESTEWEDGVVLRLDQAAMAGRYPDDRRGDPLGDDLCCVSASGLSEVINTLVVLIEVKVQESRESLSA